MGDLHDELLHEHLPYEICMMRYALSALNSHQTQLDWNCFIESFAIHGRNCYHFFTNDEKNTGFRANEFVRDFKATKTDRTKSIYPKINSQIQHFGKSRVGGEANKLSIDDAKDLTEWIEASLAKFLEQLDVEQRSVWNEQASKPPLSRPPAGPVGATGPAGPRG